MKKKTLVNASSNAKFNFLNNSNPNHNDLNYFLGSSGMPKGHAHQANDYCKKIPSRLAPPGNCLKKNGNALCTESCRNDNYIIGVCLHLPTPQSKIKCYCSIFGDDGYKCPKHSL